MKVLLALLLSSSMVFASPPPKIDNTRLFVKVSNVDDLPKSDLIKKVTPLFANNYIILTKDAQKLKNILKKYASVLKTEFNYIADKKKLPEIETQKTTTSTENFDAFNDPRVSNVWSFRDRKRNGVSVNKAYLNSINDHKYEVIVAVVDTGVDYEHEDLKQNMWVNLKEIPHNNVDDDNNGYIDDIHGIDTLSKNSDGTSSGDPRDTHSHGTHVAGTIGAVQNNNIGIAGIAEKVKIMAIRAVPNRSDETDADVVESFLYAAKHGARIINCSFGKNHNEGGDIVNETIDYIGSTYGTLVIAAAGNDYGRNIDSRQTYPASFESDYLLVVASTNSRGSLSFFSNIGRNSVDVAAPGSGVYSTTPNNRYANMSGTSMASPTTAGVAAEILSQYPSLTPLELKQLLIKTVTKVSKFKRKILSGGRVDLYSALQEASLNK